MAGHDGAELLPVGLRVEPRPRRLVLAESRIRDREPELADLRDVALEELLTRLLVRLALDPPDDHRVLLGRDRVPMEVHERLPPAVERLLHELELIGRASDQREDHVAA